MNTNQHGFKWPAGLPTCAVCGRMPNDSVHVTPGKFAKPMPFSAANKPMPYPVRMHSYTLTSGLTSQVVCAECGQGVHSSVHPVGAPAGWKGDAGRRGIPAAPALAEAPAFVEEVGGKVVMLSRAVTTDVATDEFKKLASASAPGSDTFLWVQARYVEADRPNRNSDFWSTADLEFGQPSIPHGPINWLHEARHILGSIVAAKMVEGDAEVGKHIQVAGALWPWVYPQETALVQQASEVGSLWISMECISRQVACLAEDCGREMEYLQYVTAKEDRCDHMKEGQPRRLVDPVFLGAGVIVPPVRPGWANADMRVLMPKVEEAIERHAASFSGVSQDDSAAIVAQAFASAEVGD